MWTDVSEELVTSIFRVEEITRVRRRLGRMLIETSPIINPHDATSQKTVFFIATAVTVRAPITPSEIGPKGGEC
jgi:hypothetical protein